MHSRDTKSVYSFLPGIFSVINGNIKEYYVGIIFEVFFYFFAKGISPLHGPHQLAQKIHIDNFAFQVGKFHVFAIQCFESKINGGLSRIKISLLL